MEDECSTPCLTDTPANVDHLEDRLIQQQHQQRFHGVADASSNTTTPLSTPSTERLPHQAQHPARLRQQQHHLEQEQQRLRQQQQQHVVATTSTPGVSGSDSDGRHTYTLSKGSGRASPYEQLELGDDEEEEEEDDEEEDYDDLPPVQLRHPHHQRYASSSSSNRHSQPISADHRVSRPKIKSRSKSNHQGLGSID